MYLVYYVAICYSSLTITIHQWKSSHSSPDWWLDPAFHHRRQAPSPVGRSAHAQKKWQGWDLGWIIVATAGVERQNEKLQPYHVLSFGLSSRMFFFFRPTILSTQKHIYTELLFTHFTDWWFQPIWTVVVIWDHHPKWGRKFSTHVKHSKPPSKVILTYTSLIYAHDIPFFALVTLPS